MIELKTNSPPKCNITVAIVASITLFLLFVSFSSLQAQTAEIPPKKLQTWDTFLQTWDSLEQADDTYFDLYTVDEWRSAYDHLQKNEIPLQDSIQLAFIDAYLIFFKSDYTTCIPLFQQLLTERSHLTNNQLKWCLVNLEESYRRTGNLKDAIPITKERVELGFDDDFFHIYEEAGLYREAIKEYTEHNDLPTVPIRALGYYSRLGRLHRQDGQLDSAIYYYELAHKEGLEIIDKEDYPGKSIHHHWLRKYYTYQMKGEIGLIYVQQGKYREAIPYLKKDVATCKEVNEVALTVPKRLGLAEAFLALGNRNEAKLYLDTVHQINQKTDWVVHQIKYLEIAGKYYFEVGQYDSAAIFFRTGNLLSDSIETLQRENKLIATTAFLDNEQQGKLITQQRFELERAEVTQAQQRLQLILLLAGIFIVVLISVFFYLDAKRKKRAQLIALRDKETIAKQAEELKTLDQAKTRFFSNISHEFRTPLTLIEGPIQSVLSGRAASKEEIRSNLEVAERNAKALHHLIDELLDFNKMETRELSITNQPVLLFDWLSELIENYQYLCNQGGLNFSVKTEIPARISVSTDTQKVEHVLNNLLSNALKYTQNVISVELKLTGQQFSAVVEDDGPGIASEDLPRVFDRFYQTAHGQQVPHSSGIGLAYVKEIVSLLGGTIDVDSTIGKGTTFTISIPVEEITDWKPEEQIDEFATYAPGQYAYSNNKLLIVEDNIEMRGYIQQVIGNEFKIKICANGAEALEQLQHFQPDLIISDVMMPVMDGIQLLQEVKSRPDARNISFVMLTARRSQELKLEALNMGLDDYLTKPFSPIELEIRVKNLLKNQYERLEWINAEPKQVDPRKDPFVDELKNKVLENLDNSQFDVMRLAGIFQMSDRQLTRVTRKSTGMSPAAFIREVRLIKALEILQNEECDTVVEVAERVGLGRASHFSKVFFERYGRKPSQYLKNGHYMAINA